VIVQRAGLRIVVRDVAALQIVLASSVVASMLVSLVYGEWYSALGFLLAAGCSAGGGFAVYRACGKCGEPRSHHAMVIAAAGWLVGALLGALPLLFIAWLTPDDVAQSFVPAGETYRSSLETFRNPLHAVFEAMSGYTTTSLTMAVHEPSLGKGVLFYRSTITWLGGAGRDRAPRAACSSTRPSSRAARSARASSAPRARSGRSTPARRSRWPCC
jgi:trk system potassium uptake protein TrkH